MMPVVAMMVAVSDVYNNLSIGGGNSEDSQDSDEQTAEQNFHIYVGRLIARCSCLKLLFTGHLELFRRVQ